MPTGRGLPKRSKRAVKRPSTRCTEVNEANTPVWRCLSCGWVSPVTKLRCPNCRMSKDAPCSNRSFVVESSLFNSKKISRPSKYGASNSINTRTDRRGLSYELGHPIGENDDI